VVICFHAVFFAYRRWMDATSSRNAEPPRIIPWDGFKEISISSIGSRYETRGQMSEIWEWRRSRKLVFWDARDSAPGP